MKRYAKSIAADTLAQSKNNRAMNSTIKERKPVTLSEKLINLEKKFEVAQTDIAQLKIEVQLYKEQIKEAKSDITAVTKNVAQLQVEVQASNEQLLDAKVEIGTLIRENKELRTKLQEIRKIDGEIFELNKKINLGNVAGKVIGVEEFEGATATTNALLPNQPTNQMPKKLSHTLPRNTEAVHKKILHKLPCNTEAEMKVLKEDLLRDLDTFTYMETRFGLIGGSDPKSCLAAILDRLFSRDLQSKMTLTGKRTDKTVILKDYPILMDLINNAVRIAHANYKDKEGETMITKILSSK